MATVLSTSAIDRVELLSSNLLGLSLLVSTELERVKDSLFLIAKAHAFVKRISASQKWQKQKMKIFNSPHARANH